MSDVRKLRDLLVSLGAEKVRNTGRSGMYVVPGVDAEIAVPLRDRDHLPHDALRKVASAFGISQPELRDLMDKKVAARHGSGRGKRPEPAPGVTRREVLDKADEVKRALADVEASCRGDRDVRYYRHSLTQLHAALLELRRPLPAAPSADAPVAPMPERLDDSKFRPSRRDSLLDGPARATGATAAAVRRGQTFTAWEHEQRQARDGSTPQSRPSAERTRT